MTKISIDPSAFQNSISSAKGSVSSLQGNKLTATDLNGTTLNPFVQLIQVEKEIDSKISVYVNVAQNDTNQFDITQQKVLEADNIISGGFNNM
ncbi:hypothetical protein [Companilactobacillus sp.]|jgi:hypothetical protein|uniref:hypothetical protein n=1 Tax=Companilactobacillus sp. TaxID=2767905 RepID=UPI0025BF7D72|nr:hypothetical protein [Companilactobacillus sp.]MCH4009491.1 hypothetical protein [Companilactobacillus sp.]MCH4052833.1 hypothetical protein [Companilactobacillus sp.]MCH4077433.1 hypothetical protein [Companilactobacillus sp.]MCH4126009.1 hypothetical protein [Companilactobacillus sp.]MCI1311717.1 hypothetical protein [Companilactobacillus sp.]